MNLANTINDFLENKQHGTVFKISLNDGERPKLSYLNAKKAEQWLDILKVRTPLGGVYLTTNEQGKFKPTVQVYVTDSEGNQTSKYKDGAEYYLPHEIPNLKVQAISDLNKAIESLTGGLDERFSKLPDKFKKLNAVWEVWSWRDILDSQSQMNLQIGLSDEQQELVEKHRVSVYGFFCNSTRIFERFNDDILQIRRGYRILKGGLQLGSDGMTQGDVITIPLTRAVWYQNQAHVIVHFEQGQPDLGRKTFQPDKTELAIKLSINVINLLTSVA